MKNIREVSFENKEDKAVLQLCKDRKLSVSSVKYSRGHDGDCMNCNVKIGTKIVGNVWDDSWGGELQFNDKSQAVKVLPFIQHINSIIDEAPKFKYRDLVMDYSVEMVMDTMINEAKLIKDCKTKCVVMVKKSDDENARVDTFTFKMKFDNSVGQINRIKGSMQKDGYTHIEILNKRLI